MVLESSASMQAAAGNVAWELEKITMPVDLLPCCNLLPQLLSDTLILLLKGDKGIRSLLPKATQICRLRPLHQHISGGLGQQLCCFLQSPVPRTC